MPRERRAKKGEGAGHFVEAWCFVLKAADGLLSWFCEKKQLIH